MSAKPAKPTTADQYLAGVPEDRRAAVSAIRDVIRKNLPKGYEEGIQYGMIGYFVPHSVYPPGYHCDPKQPLPFASIANQKGHIGIYLFCVYMDEARKERFQKAWLASGKRLDMGKSCVRVKKLEDVPLDVLGEAIRSAPAKDVIAQYEKMRDASGKGKATKTAAKKSAVKKSAKKPAAKQATKKAASKQRAANKPAAKKATKRARKG